MLEEGSEEIESPKERRGERKPAFHRLVNVKLFV